MKRKIRLVDTIAIFSLLLAGCSGVKNITMDYTEVKAKPAYGYITLDFSKSHEVPYGRNYVEGKTDYTIMYNRQGKVLFLKVENVPFTEKTFNAYIPKVDGYAFRNMSRLFFLEGRRDRGQTFPQSYFVNVYSVSADYKLYCPEIAFKNGQTFDAEVGCPDDWRDKNGAQGIKDILGDVAITPHFAPDYPFMFTNRPSPVRASVGS